MSDSVAEESSKIQTDVAMALDALAGAYRGDWSTFDGRTLRDQLQVLSTALTTGEFYLGDWARSEDLCLTCHSWLYHCHCHPGDDD